MGSDQFDYLFKFLIIGNAGTGKTCILRRYLERKFSPDTKHTIGAEFGRRIISVDGTNVKIQIWDTSGHERFRSVTRCYYRDAVGTLLVYDITNRASFSAVEQWLGDARQLAAPGVVVILVGNKKDLQDTDGQVTHWEANKFAQENGLQFIETSALTGENIDDAFTSCVRVLLSKLKSGELQADPLLAEGSRQNFRSVNLTGAATSSPASQSSAPAGQYDGCSC